MKKIEKEYLINQLQELMYTNCNKLSKKDNRQFVSLIEKLKHTKTEKSLLGELFDFFRNRKL